MSKIKSEEMTWRSFSRGIKESRLPPSPRLVPLARLCSRGLLVRISAPNLARSGVSKVTFAKFKQPLDPRAKRSLRDAFLHSRTVGSKPLHKALARAFSRFFCNLREARGRRDLTNYCGFWKGFALLARFFSTFLALRCTTNYLVIVARIHT